MELVSRLQDAQCVGVRRGKDRCIVDGLCKQLLDHLISILDGGPGKVAVMEPGFQPELPAGPQIALRPELMGSGVPAAEVQDLPVSQSVEILHPQIGASAVVHRYVALGLIPQILAEKHRRDLLQQRGDLLIGGRGLGDDQNPVHPAAQQQFDHHLLLFQIRL